MILTGRASAGCLWAAPAVLRLWLAPSPDWRASLSSPCVGPPAWGRPSPQAWQPSKRSLSVFRLNSKWWVFKRVLHQILIENISIMKLFRFPISSKILLKIHIVYFSVDQDALLDTVRRSRVHFVHCLLPRAEVLRAAGSPEESCDPGLMQIDVALLRAQIRGFKLLDSLRIYRQGEKRDQKIQSNR